MVVYKKNGNKVLAPLVKMSDNSLWRAKTTKVGANTWYDVTFGNGKFVAVGSQYMTSSTDGLTWTTPTQVSENWWGITFSGQNGRYIAVGANGYTSTSTDGITWTTPVRVGTNTWYGIITGFNYGSDYFVAVGSSGYITTSWSGLTWSTPVRVGTNTWYGITYKYANSTYVVVGANGYIMTSRNGDTWTTPVQVGTDAWWGITYGNDKFIAVGANGYITTSSDGSTWSTPIQVGANTWYDVTFGDGKFVAVGTYNVAVSIDGITWEISSIGQTWNGITYGNGKFVAVGGGGYITTGSLYKLFTLAYGKDTTYEKDTNIASVPIIYAKNDESKTVYVPNVTFTGSVQSASLYEPEILTGFSSTSYCQTPTPTFPAASATSWEWHFRFKYKQTGIIQRIYSQNKTYPSGIEIGADGKLCLTMSTSTSSYNIINAVKGTTILENGKWYDVIVTYSSSGYTVQLIDINTETLTTEITSTKTNKIASTANWRIGHDASRNSGNTAFSGEIDLKNSYINVDNARWWSGTDGTVTVSKNSYDRKTEKIKRYI